MENTAIEVTDRKAAFKVLRAELAAAVAEVKAIRKERTEKKSEPKSPERSRELQDLWIRKLEGRPGRRWYSLALAYLKGRAYEACERNVCSTLSIPYYLSTTLTEAGIPTKWEEISAWVEASKITGVAA